MEEDKLWLSQTMLKDHKNMCHLAFHYRWFTEYNQRWQDVMDAKSVIRKGIYFETFAIGSGLKGKTITLTKEEEKSVFFPRLKEQAEKYRKWEKSMGFKVIGTQKELSGIIEQNGIEVPVRGNIDRLVRQKNGRLMVIDLKYSSDTESAYGPFQWSNPDKIEPIQVWLYAKLVEQNYNEPCDMSYYVVDDKPDLNRQWMPTTVGEWKDAEYRGMIVDAYNEISVALAVDYWEPDTSKCNGCPVADICPNYIDQPDIIFIDK